MHFKSRAAEGEEARLGYWRATMERSRDLHLEMARHAYLDCGETLVSIRDAAAAAGVEMLFSQSLLAGRFERIYYIRQGLVESLVAIGRDMNRRGWLLQIEDAYRSYEMQLHLGRAPAVFDMIVAICRRECGGQAPPLELVERRAACLVANSPLLGTHLFAAAVDISVFRAADGTQLDRGGPYLEMSEITPMLSPFVTPEQHDNRMAITGVMERHGFMHYPGEFWHYNKGDALYQLLAQTGRPGIYGPVHWDAASNSITPYDDVLSPLTPPAVMQDELEAALGRLSDAHA